MIILSDSQVIVSVQISRTDRHPRQGGHAIGHIGRYVVLDRTDIARMNILSDSQVILSVQISRTDRHPRQGGHAIGHIDMFGWTGQTEQG